MMKLSHQDVVAQAASTLGIKCPMFRLMLLFPSAFELGVLLMGVFTLVSQKDGCVLMIEISIHNREETQSIFKRMKTLFQNELTRFVIPNLHRIKVNNLYHIR